MKLIKVKCPKCNKDLDIHPTVKEVSCCGYEVDIKNLPIFRRKKAS